MDRRDALCHLAARANDVPLILRLLDWHLDLASGAAEAEAINAGQIASRAGRSVDELADEAVAGYAAARADVLKLDAAQLSQTIPDVPGQGPMSVADLVLVVYRHHAQAHLASIEQALAQRANERTEGCGVTWLRLIGGIVLVLLGLLWIGQGLNLLAGSAMSGQAMWAIIGVLVALVGACLLGAPRAGAAPMPCAPEASAQWRDRPGERSDTLASSR